MRLACVRANRRPTQVNNSCIYTTVRMYLEYSIKFVNGKAAALLSHPCPSKARESSRDVELQPAKSNSFYY